METEVETVAETEEGTVAAMEAETEEVEMEEATALRPQLQRHDRIDWGGISRRHSCRRFQKCTACTCGET